ncbi:MAG: DUF2461 domain-containing protein [Oscillospiraceae bacterium]|nr:DUF2461 domain-containing protein [Oscillospiraceae bacterium]
MNTLFSKKSIEFLVENRLRNDKAWFEEHKSDYQKYLVEPFKALVTALAPALSDIDGKLICSPKIDGSISRIWRDIRFSKDKSLFRDMMWCMFVREKHVNLPEFFFVISPDNFFYGSGYYSAGTSSMESIRKLILDGDKDFKAALKVYENQNLFALEGDTYKKSRFPGAPENLRNWLNRKGICFIHYSADFDLLYSEKLPDVVAEGYRTLEPIYKFLIKAEERK